MLFISTHQAGGWPGTGALKEVGQGAGEGYTINMPLPGVPGGLMQCTVLCVLERARLNHVACGGMPAQCMESHACITHVCARHVRMGRRHAGGMHCLTGPPSRAADSAQGMPGMRPWRQPLTR